jgi:alkanesulfonate monooxygenase SsuD/methylene tetrahydromethanopterin reductase-like flavin-dependent oxidoreductase (luciferase family)
MEIGIFSFSTDYSMPVDQLAVAIEERGFESLWVAEHTHFLPAEKPPSRMTVGCPRNIPIR